MCNFYRLIKAKNVWRPTPVDDFWRNRIKCAYFMHHIIWFELYVYYFISHRFLALSAGQIGLRIIGRNEIVELWTLFTLKSLSENKIITRLRLKYANLLLHVMVSVANQPTFQQNRSFFVSNCAYLLSKMCNFVTFLTAEKSIGQSEIGIHCHLDVGDGCLRWNVFVTTVRYW